MRLAIGDRVRLRDYLHVLGPSDREVAANSRGTIIDVSPEDVWRGAYVEFDKGGFGIWVSVERLESLNVVELMAEED